MPIPSSKNIGIKLGKGARGTASIVEDLKLQHAEELAAASEEHAKKVETLEKEIEQCRSEIDALRAVADENCDTLTPLPSPSKTLKFVKNTNRKGRKGGGIDTKNVVKMVADIKTQHKKDLARAAEIYAKKLHALKKEAERYKAEAEALKAASAKRAGGGDAGVSMNTGVADNDKENMPNQSSFAKQKKDTAQKLPPKSDNTTPPSQKDDATATRNEGHLDHQYERLFYDNWVLEKDPKYDAAVANDTVKMAVSNADVEGLCKGLMKFVEDVKATSLMR